MDNRFRGTQCAQQKGIHTTPLGNQNYYLDYSNFNRYMFMSSGYYNPFSLWGR